MPLRSHLLPSRRTLLRSAPFAPVFATALSGQNFADTKPKPQQLAWQDLEIGVLIHFGPNTFQDREWGDGTAAPSVFDPKQLDAEQWVLAAKAGGARYLVMVAKHHDGFCLWPSRHTDYSVKSSPWRGGKGDLVKEAEQACRKHGLKFGIYLSPWDRHEPAYKDDAKYDDYYDNQMRELCTRYGELVEIWLDGAGSEGHRYDFDRYARTIRTYQPNANIFADTGFLQYGDVRWVGNEDGYASEENWNVIDRLGYLRYRPVEADTPLRKRHWFWHPNDEKSLKSLGELAETHLKTVGRGAQLVLGLAPDDRGLMPESDALRLKEFGALLSDVYGKPLLGANTILRSGQPGFPAGGGQLMKDSSAVLDADSTRQFAAPASERSLDVIAQFGEPLRFDRVLLREWLGEGQTIAAYSVDAATDAASPSAWREIARGTTIGSKRIHVFPAIRATALRLRIQNSIGPVRLRGLQVYDGNSR
ncbi:MAG: alpha-L-fucosidase [Bryobacterales bacterium]|nr:alpha-L-fucosidase [Bryobacterales bacterium]